MQKKYSTTVDANEFHREGVSDHWTLFFFVSRDWTKYDFFFNVNTPDSAVVQLFHLDCTRRQIEPTALFSLSQMKSRDQENIDEIRIDKKYEKNVIIYAILNFAVHKKSVTGFYLKAFKLCLFRICQCGKLHTECNDNPTRMKFP